MPAGAGRLGFWYLNQQGQTEINFLADWMILTYTFIDGRDLDTRTKMISPDGGGDYVGWGRDNTQAGILTWGGDNTGTGVESVLVGIGGFRSLYPGVDTITIDCRCMWYSQVGYQPVVLSAKLYRGGGMIRNGYTWDPLEPEATFNLNSQGKVISYHSTSSSDNGYHFSNITYNVNTGIGIINILDI